jgi:hypothetical protein
LIALLWRYPIAAIADVTAIDVADVIAAAIAAAADVCWGSSYCHMDGSVFFVLLVLNRIWQQG